MVGERYQGLREKRGEGKGEKGRGGEQEEERKKRRRRRERGSEEEEEEEVVVVTVQQMKKSQHERTYFWERMGTIVPFTQRFLASCFLEKQTMFICPPLVISTHVLCSSGFGSSHRGAVRVGASFVSSFFDSLVEWKH